MSKEDKKPKGLRMTSEMMDELFGSIEDADPIPTGYSRIRETGEGEILKRYKKIETKDIFSLTPLYDVDNPLQIPAVWISIHKNIRDSARITKIVDNYEYLILRAERDELKSEVQRLLSKIDEIDKEYIPSFGFTLEQTLSVIGDSDRANKFKKYMHHLWNSCRRCSQGGVQNMKERLFEFDEIPKIARENIEDTIKSLFAKKSPLFEKLQDKIERYATFQRAIKQYPKTGSKELSLDQKIDLWINKNIPNAPDKKGYKEIFSVICKQKNPKDVTVTHLIGEIHKEIEQPVVKERRLRDVIPEFTNSLPL